MADRPLNATAASLLGFLHAGPMSGWDLVATAQVLIGDFWTLNRSQVYRELTAMTERGLVEPGEVERRERVPYALTPAGRAAFAEWIATEPGSETIRFPLLVTIALGAHLPPDQLATFVHRHRAVHVQRLAEYEQMESAARDTDGAGDPYAMATLQFGLAYERAVLDWFEQLPATIRGSGPWRPDPPA